MAVIQLIDVTIRDALQRVNAYVPASVKRDLVQALANAGLTHLEVTAFRPDNHPQFTDAVEVLATPLAKSVTLRALCYHADGVRRALDAGAGEIGLNVSVDDAFEARFHRTAADALGEAKAGATLASQAGVPCIASVSSAIPLDTGRLFRVTDALVSTGISGITLAETAGGGDLDAAAIAYAAVATRYPCIPVTVHLHEGAVSAIEKLADTFTGGCRSFEVGLSPQPARGDNADTIGVLRRLDAMGLPAGISVQALEAAQSILMRAAALS